MEILQRLKALKSVWGAVTSLTILFPGASYLLNINDVKDSVLSGYYVAFSTVLCLLVILLILSFGNTKKNASRTLVSVIVLGAVAAIAFLGFVAIKSVVIYDKEVFSSNENTGNKELIAYSKSGMINVSASSLDGSQEKNSNYRFVNIWEVVSLALFTFSITLFGSAFTTIGLFQFENRKK